LILQQDCLFLPGFAHPLSLPLPFTLSPADATAIAAFALTFGSDSGEKWWVKCSRRARSPSPAKVRTKAWGCKVGHQLRPGERVLCWVRSSQQPCTDSAGEKHRKGFKNPTERCPKGKEGGDERIPTEFWSCFQCRPEDQSWMLRLCYQLSRREREAQSTTNFANAFENTTRDALTQLGALESAGRETRETPKVAHAVSERFAARAPSQTLP